MTAKNDITGDNIKSKLNSKEYRDNYDNIRFNALNANRTHKPANVTKLDNPNHSLQSQLTALKSLYSAPHKQT